MGTSVCVDDRELASQFESLGFNCEFGFVQHDCGWRQGGLLRWALVQPEPLLRGIASGFEGIYDFANLQPRNPKMVTDQATGLGFHSAMQSAGGAFVHDEAERRRLHLEERDKILAMRDRLLRQLASGRHMFVYKDNAGLAGSHIRKIAAAVASRGPGRVLHVVAAEQPDQVGTVEHAGGNLFLGRLRKLWLRDPDPANIDYAGWRTLLRNAVPHLP
ncbi:hypothetical protein [Mangrovicoccus ximenensis]|uniref:hypothetical protein n=1 Tax=Mangrovicoccus ximenensis TaxID=1911570 RepID=UPI0011AE1B2A|nr:hypothetical protein [Mangrovicoccus ximenensis]